jgi:hypothetical protein
VSASDLLKGQPRSRAFSLNPRLRAFTNPGIEAEVEGIDLTVLGSPRYVLPFQLFQRRFFFFFAERSPDSSSPS